MNNLFLATSLVTRFSKNEEILKAECLVASKEGRPFEIRETYSSALGCWTSEYKIWYFEIKGDK